MLSRTRQLKPAPSLGVFSKGRASAKKKVTATRKSCKYLCCSSRERSAQGDSASKNELFSESAFLNKPNEQAADHAEIDDDSDENSDSSISNRPTPQATRITDCTKKDRGKCTETTALKTPQASTHTIAESEIWDIELQSRLPSSARDVSSEPGANDSAPVVLDLRGAQWSASINEAEEFRGKIQTRSLSVTRRGHSVVRSSPLARSDLNDEHGRPHAADTGAPSIHPSHSASQVGRRPSDLHPVTSQYFTEEPVSVQKIAANSPQTSRSNDGLDLVLDSRIPNEDIQDTTLDVQIQRAASPISSLMSVVQPMVAFQTRYDVVPLRFPSDCSSYDDCLPLEPLREPFDFESSVVETWQGDRSIGGAAYHELPHHGANWTWCPDLADDVEYVSMEGSCDPFWAEYESAAEHDPGEGQWFCMTETGGDLSVDGSICCSEEDVSDFLEGRALLLGVPEEGVGLSGLAQAEMDVASGLRNHWRPLRLS